MIAGLLNKEERKKFLELICKLASCDGELDAQEQKMIQNYMGELSLSEVPDTDSLQALTDYFAKKDERVKKAVLYEICGIILSDSNVGENEQRAFDAVKSAFALDPRITEEIVSIANDEKILADQLRDILEL